MSLTAAVIDALVASGCSAEQLAAAVKAANAEAEAKAAEKRANDAARKRRQRANGHTMSHDVTRTDADSTDAPSSPEVSPQTPFPNPTNPRHTPPKGPPLSSPAVSDFDAWYRHYPHKVQRGTAERAFPKALRLAGSVDVLIAGVKRYVASKPADRPWLNPASWLNGKAWMDAPAEVAPTARGSPKRPTEDFIDSLVNVMDQADANSTAEIEGYQAAALRLPGPQW